MKLRDILQVSFFDLLDIAIKYIFEESLRFAQVTNTKTKTNTNTNCLDR